MKLGSAIYYIYVAKKKYLLNELKCERENCLWVELKSITAAQVLPLSPPYYSRPTILTAAGLIYSTYRDVLGPDSDKPFPHSPIVGNQCHALVRQNISVQPRRNNIAVVSRNVV